jgi:tryptophanyl-tRNA synthetase
MSSKPRILTGDTPTGRLHLGHWVGSVKRRVELQSTHDCYFIIANYHAFTTRCEKSAEIRVDCLEIVRDYLAMGIDPDRATVFLQSEIPAIHELCFLFAMLLPFNRVMRNPTLKDEIKVKDLGETYSFGFPLYAVGQCADILTFRPVGVPVGEDQVPHLEMTREVARRFNQIYCGVDEHAEDHDHVKLGGVFPVPRADVGKVGRLVGIDGKKKVMKIFTGRQSPTEPGDVNNALFQYVEAFIPDAARVAELKDRYARGDNLGDGHVKKEVAAAINELLEPMRQRRAQFEGRDDLVLEILRKGCARANDTAEATLEAARKAAHLQFFPRSVTYR